MRPSIETRSSDRTRSSRMERRGSFAGADSNDDRSMRPGARRNLFMTGLTVHIDSVGGSAKESSGGSQGASGSGFGSCSGSDSEYEEPETSVSFSGDGRPGSGRSRDAARLRLFLVEDFAGESLSTGCTAGGVRVLIGLSAKAGPRAFQFDGG